MTVEKRRVFDLANCGSDLLSQADRELISNNSAEYNGYIKRSEALSLVKETRKDGPYPVEWNEWLQRWFIQARELALEFPEIVDEIYDDERFKDDTQPILAPIIQNIVSECPEYIKRFPRAVGRKVM
jgi:hypothetical protein